MALKELTNLDSLTSGSSVTNSKSKSLAASVDELLGSLTAFRNTISQEPSIASDFTALSRTVDARKKDIDDRQKEIYSSIVRLGKGLDKIFIGCPPLHSHGIIFKEQSSLDALDRAVAVHLMRTGQFISADTFIKEVNLDISVGLYKQFHELHHVLLSLRAHDVLPGLQWADRNSAHLRDSDLLFHLHRFHTICMLLQSSPQDTTTPARAVEYAKSALAPFWSSHTLDCKRLFGCIAYWKDLRNSPYADLTAPSIQEELQSLFTVEFCARLQMGGEPPLRVVADIGGNGALARIERGRKVMRERKGEWSQEGELPMEIPLPPQNRYHSVFTCPVSKEQASEENPPMMMLCGHVINRDSLQKLSRNGKVKCPYCPAESQKEAAIRVYF